MDIPTLVIDFGSNSIKAGMSKCELPDIIIPSYFPKGKENFDITAEIPDDSALDYAIVKGEVANENRLKYIFAYLYNRYFPKEDPDELRVIFTETPFASKKSLSFLSDLVFDLLNATEISVKPQGVYDMVPFTLPTSICINIGHDIAQVVPMSNGFAIPNAIMRSEMAGRAIELFILRCVMDLDDFSTLADVKSVKEYLKTIRISPNFKEEALSIDESNDDELTRIKCGEILFNPKLMEDAALDPDSPEDDAEVGKYMEEMPPHLMINESIEMCPLTIRGDLWSNIIVCGGATQIKGFRERFEKELENIKPPNSNVHLRFAEDPVLATWIGEEDSAKFDGPENWLTYDDYSNDSGLIFEKFRTFGTSFNPYDKDK